MKSFGNVFSMEAFCRLNGKIFYLDQVIGQVDQVQVMGSK